MQWTSVTIGCGNCSTISLTFILFIVVVQRPTRCWGPTWCCPPVWWSWGPRGALVGPGSAAAPRSPSPPSQTLSETPAAAPRYPSGQSTASTASSATDTHPSLFRYARLQNKSLTFSGRVTQPSPFRNTRLQNKSPVFLWNGNTPDTVQLQAPSK